MKPMMTALSLILAAAGVLFWKQVWGMFAGMTIMEAMEFIVTFILHVAVGTIAAYVVFGLPKIIKPWVRLFQWKQRNALRGRRRNIAQVKTPVVHPRRMTVKEMLSLLAPEQSIRKAPTKPQQDPAELRF